MTPHWERNNTTITDRLKKLKSFHNGSYGADIDEAIKAIEALEEIEKFIQNSINLGIYNGTLRSISTIINEDKRMVHELKIQPQYYHDVKCGIKRFELRKDDRNYNIGDHVILKEYDNGAYTGNETKPMEILYILKNCPEYGLKEGYCILGLKG